MARGSACCVRPSRRPTVDPEVRAVFDRAVDDLRAAGATVLDTVTVVELDSIRRSNRGGCNPFKFEFNAGSPRQGDRAPRARRSTRS